MASLLEEIRKQPKIVREIMFGLSVVTAVAIVGAVWFRSFEHNLYALMNPDQQTEEKYVAQQEELKTPLAFLGKAVESLRAMIANFFNATDVAKPENKILNNNTGEPRPLPLSK
ncbi:MAG TPA: hypothetical protein VEK36_00195 [Candidatus Paceibacterota bacterium]|nr:hypothetical protein [Candidatus Paceibacterota bacterium]